MPMTTTVETWKSLERIVAPRNSEFSALRPGASEETLAEVEKTIGRRLPDDLRELLALHDGHETTGEIFMNHRLSSSDQIAKWWRFWYARPDPGYTNVRPSRAFVELTQSDGDNVLVDLDDRKIYFHVRAEGVFGPLAPSLRAWLAELLDRIADGRAEFVDIDGEVLEVDDWNPAHIPSRYPRVS